MRWPWQCLRGKTEAQMQCNETRHNLQFADGAFLEMQRNLHAAAAVLPPHMQFIKCAAALVIRRLQFSRTLVESLVQNVAKLSCRVNIL
jgi:hypothetical protein